MGNYAGGTAYHGENIMYICKGYSGEDILSSNNNGRDSYILSTNHPYTRYYINNN